MTKYEFSRLQAQLIIILEGLRESDLNHYQIERSLDMEIRKISSNDQIKSDDNKKPEDRMFG